MALNPNALILPAKGTIFVGPVDTPPPTIAQLATISPSSPPTSMVCLGHTSAENLPKYGKDGGEATQMGSWWDDAVESTVSPQQWSLGCNSLQSDATSLELGFGGGTLDDVAGTYDVGNVVAQSRCILLLMVGGTKRRGLYHPRASITLGDAPEIDREKFFEIPLMAQLLQSQGAVAWAGKWMRVIDASLVATP